jgi:CDP-glycerol glycerophosphotransferase (TagB/SpsB family)
MLLRNTPLTFPILELADAYVGDMSSIAYDFLGFDRPMVFLNQTAGDVGDASESLLFSCGAVVDPVDYRSIYQALEDEIIFHQNRSELKQRLYHRVYADLLTLEDLRYHVEDALKYDPPTWLWGPE